MIVDGTIQTADIAPNAITSPLIADGTIQATDIALNGVHKAIGTYNATPTFSTTSVGTWVTAPVSVTGAFSGNIVRVQLATILQHTAGGGQPGGQHVPCTRRRPAFPSSRCRVRSILTVLRLPSCRSFAPGRRGATLANAYMSVTLSLSLTRLRRSG